MAGTLIAGSLSNGVKTASIEKLMDSNVSAWLNMDGTGNIRASFNVSSVTLISTGKFQVNFAVPMSHANYACAGFASWSNDTAAAGLVSGIGSHKTTQLTTSVVFYAVNSTTGTTNAVVNDVQFAVFGG